MSLGGGRGTVSLGIVSPGAIAGYGALHIIHWGDFVFTNVAPTNNDGQIRRLREVNLSDKSLHDPQRFGQRPSVEFGNWTLTSYNVDVAKILQEVSE